MTWTHSRRRRCYAVQFQLEVSEVSCSSGEGTLTLTAGFRLTMLVKALAANFYRFSTVQYRLEVR